MPILTLNGGSSSIRFALYDVGAGAALTCRLAGKVDRAGTRDATLSVDGEPDRRHPVPATDACSAAASLLDWLEAQAFFGDIEAIGHRVVHGMNHADPERIGAALLAELHRLEPLDPDHLPGAMALIEQCTRRLPRAMQVACFDTAFHRHMPRVARMLAIPRRYEAIGLRRYGFHGLSYASLMEGLERSAGVAAARGKVVLAHLGHGASIAAVLGGQGIDTSMGFSPTSGLPMGTRSGDLDPGVAPYLARTEGMTGDAFYAMASHESGLLGISETSSDMRDLLAREAGDIRAAEAVALFCYQAKKYVGACAAALGGLDTLVFAGGVGENAAPVRERICAGLGFLGIELDAARNAAAADVISTDASRVAVRIIRADEELMIARGVCQWRASGT